MREKKEWGIEKRRGVNIFVHPSPGSRNPSPAGRQNRQNSGQTFISAAFLAGSVPD
jgi:hypothetical protein